MCIFLFDRSVVDGAYAYARVKIAATADRDRLQAERIFDDLACTAMLQVTWKKLLQFDALFPINDKVCCCLTIRHKTAQIKGCMPIKVW